MHGHGVYTYKGGSKYVGDWINGKQEGQGRMEYVISGQENPSVYIGEWKDGKRDGKGVYYYSNGNVYDGSWKENLRHGIGRLVLTN